MLQLQQPLPFNATPPSMTTEAAALPINGTAPAATISNSATPSNIPSTPAAPRDGKSAAQSDFPTPLPSQAQAHGAPVRQYLNEHLTPYLLEVSKHLAAHRYATPGLTFSNVLAD